MSSAGLRVLADEEVPSLRKLQSRKEIASADFLWHKRHMALPFLVGAMMKYLKFLVREHGIKRMNDDPVFRVRGKRGGSVSDAQA